MPKPDIVILDELFENAITPEQWEAARALALRDITRGRVAVLRTMYHSDDARFTIEVVDAEA